MDIKEFARNFKHNGVSIVIDEMTEAFAEAYARRIVGEYLIDNGLGQIQMGNALIAPPPEEKKSLIV
jgi:hypothetical protein